MIKEIAAKLPGESKLFDAHLLLSQITGHNRAWFLSHPDAVLNPDEAQQLLFKIKKIQEGSPLPYVLGHWEFFGLDFIVSPDVLIPRPETELLVENAISHVRANPQLEINILDIGTGSGIISISLAVHIPNSYLCATDISKEAISIATRNAIRNGVEQRIDFIECDLVPETLDLRKFDIITANLPYIPTSTLHELEIYNKEPSLALDGGQDGLVLISRLLNLLDGQVNPGCLILLEIENDQGLQVTELVREIFPLAVIRVLRDLSGFDRIVSIIC